MKSKAIVCALIVFLLIDTGDCIECFQCNSSSDIECSETFDPENTHLRPTPCDDVYEAKYCIKTTGIYGGLMGTQRFCSSRHIGNQCEYIRRSGDVREQRSCVFTCSRDGCNSAGRAQLSAQLILISLIIRFLFNTFRFVPSTLQP